MVKAMSIPPPGFEDLSVDEKLDYVQTPWEHIAASPETLPVPDWHTQIISERVAHYQAHPESVKSWEQVRAELEKKLAKKS